MWLGGGVDEDDRLDAAAARQVLRRSLAMLRPYRMQMVAASASVALWVGTVLAGPLLVKVAIDEGIAKDNSSALNLAVVAYVVVAGLAYLLSRYQIRAINRIGEEFLRDLRIRLFTRLQRQSMPFYDRTKSGIIVSRMTADIDSMQELVQMGLLMLATNLLLLTLSFVVLAVVSWQMLLACLVAVPVVALASIRFQRESNRVYLQVREHIASVLTTLQESLAGVRVIQAHARNERERQRFSVVNDELYDAHVDSVKVQAWYIPIVEYAGAFTTALVLALGGWMVIDGRETVGTVAFFVLTLSNLFEPVQHLSQLFNVVQSAGAALRKIFELIDEPIDVAERQGSVDLPERGTLEVSAVGFAYGDGPQVLSDVDLTISFGERIALVGPTGAGKSTLAKLLVRLYDPTDGAIRYGGVDLTDATMASLRRRIVMVPQEGYLFGGTIRDNIRLARTDATDAEIDRAVSALGMAERFALLESGIDTDVGERGSRLSAGERQLVSLARAGLVDPDVLVLDEATSNLDPGTEQVVETALERLMDGRTTIVVAHRLTTSERADRVVVVADGSLLEVGTHEELLANGRHYSQMFATWTAGVAG